MREGAKTETKRKDESKKVFLQRESFISKTRRQTDRQRNRYKATRHMPACFNYTTNGTNAAYSHIEKEKDKKKTNQQQRDTRVF